MSMVEFAERELRAAGLFDSDSDYDGAIGPAVLELVNVLSKQEHSGFSHSLVMSVLNRVANFKPLSPLTNDPDEWMLVGPGAGDKDMWQSNRNSEAFSEDGGKTYYLLDEAMYRYGCKSCACYYSGWGTPELGTCGVCGQAEEVTHPGLPELRHTALDKNTSVKDT